MVPISLGMRIIDGLSSYLAYIMDNCDDPSQLNLVGRRQFGVDPYHHDLLKIAVRKPGGTYELFKVGALPFGAVVGSVTAFLRVSNCISFICSKALHFVLTASFDDFTVVCSNAETATATFCMAVCWEFGLQRQGTKHLHLHTLSKPLDCSYHLNNWMRVSSSWNTQSHEGRKCCTRMIS